LDKLIETVTNHLTYDNEFLDVFVLTYRSFTTPEELLDKLITRYNTPPPFIPRKDKTIVRGGISVSMQPSDDDEEQIIVELGEEDDEDSDYEYVNEFYLHNRNVFVQFIKTFLFRMRMRVSIVLKNWMERHFADFREDKQARKKLQVLIAYFVANVSGFHLS
jgi:hypothetical protein